MTNESVKSLMESSVTLSDTWLTLMGELTSGSSPIIIKVTCQLIIKKIKYIFAVLQDFNILGNTSFSGGLFAL